MRSKLIKAYTTTCHTAHSVSYLLSIMDVVWVVKTRLTMGFHTTLTDEYD